MLKRSLLAAAVVPLLWACDDASGPEGSNQVSVRFQAVAATAAGVSSGAAAVPIIITGSNGTLVIDDIQLIVTEIELERRDGECADDADDDCEEFEGGPFLVNLIDGAADEVVRGLVPAGSYTELEFEIENLDLDDDDDNGERQRKQAILTQIRELYPAFPGDASMVVHGTFNDQPFTVYFDAEIEVEHEFAIPFRVPEDLTLTVNLSPSLWFKPGSQVLNLRAFDGQTLEFEAEFEDGVLEVEFDD